jgi:hypothetical protein
MLNLVAGGIPGSLEFCQRLGVTVPADARILVSVSS